ncbi:MAG: 16S rRNA (uracil(1498)-N(3))-methyltransferase [Desulfobacteraceae bacterium]|nr:16S rRNA (uracil(1498)-N(3))-methyltransferase [Desulfobacteraceae bacterium]MBC2718284.1 16S rRNA (uracil(1498)-N(3))-methyltransferase [Desulfobacteraceae bacterium]
MRRFFIEQSKIASTKIFITGSDAAHIKKVLRMKSEDSIGLFDGRGFEYEAKIENLLAESIEVSITKCFLSASESPVMIIVAQALLKDKKMDSLTRQLTEIGVARLIPFTSIRSVPGPDKKRLSTRKKRWEKISIEALKQCRRGHVTKIGETITFNDVIKIDDECDLKIVFWENESKPVNGAVQQVHDRHYRKILAVLGPEGGFSKKEIEDARACGFVTASLGPRILRSETAAVAACTILQYIFGDMGLKKS